ncbi:AraC family transcriptional regulator [Sulfitobacter sp. D35]|uniref:AraC family transcriptional regulator n=1 Tax=Sulfitobacter sp. D35 TaxID=3083252 RepID=UPI00296E6A8F|nr:AraC family transcriptional regulator [Sulfitobacter sp. D35]MDW4497864.1 AraC family transcriptional regulator [Sulfitobacter sp. D35]
MTDGRTAVACQKVSGRDIVDVAGKLVQKDNASLLEKSQTSAGIEAARASLGNHESEIRPALRSKLIVSQRANGVLNATIGDAPFSAKVRTGMLTFAPAGTEQLYEFDGKVNNTFLMIDDALLRRASDSDRKLGAVGALEPRANIYWPRLERAALDYADCVFSGEVGWRILTESLTLRIACEILVGLGHGAYETGSVAPLSFDEVMRLIDFIDAELESNFGLPDLARVLDRDPFGFSRSFKAATGESPHQYVIQRRLMKVKELLQHTDDRLVDITYATGFSNQAHMTTTFSKHFGIPAEAWRRMVRA